MIKMNKKGLWKKILSVFIIILILQFAVSSSVFAVDLGGILLSPINALFLGIGDAIIDLLHQEIMGQAETMIIIDGSLNWWDLLIGAAVAFIIIVAVLVLVVGTGGLAAAAIAGVVAAVGVGIAIELETPDTLDTHIGVGFEATQLPPMFMLPLYTISPEEIFKGEILLFNVDFFSEPEQLYVEYEYITEDGNGTIHTSKVEDYERLIVQNEIEVGIKKYFMLEDENLSKDLASNQIPTSKQDTAAELRDVISSWYVTLRNIALVLMLSILLYTGIRMMLSSVASDKSKYRQLINNWVIGICLLMFMHYIMVFSVQIVKMFTDLISDATGDIYYNIVVTELNSETAIKESLEEALTNINMIDQEEIYDATSGTLSWRTNLMGQVRMQAVMHTGSMLQIGYTVAYWVLIIYTLTFSITYLKRVLTLAFLTIIAPLVAMTYAIDKMHDGSAQGFNSWLKEYLFNLLLQPLHLLLYTILISSAVSLASTNIIYMLVALGFLVPAEKIVRGLFGFNKASTAGSLAGTAIGASMITSGLTKMLARGKPGGKGGSNKPDGASSGRSNIRFDSGSNAYATLASGGNSDSSSGGSGNSGNSRQVNENNSAGTNQVSGSNNSNGGSGNSNTEYTENENGQLGLGGMNSEYTENENGQLGFEGMESEAGDATIRQQNVNGSSQASINNSTSANSAVSSPDTNSVSSGSSGQSFGKREAFRRVGKSLGRNAKSNGKALLKNSAKGLAKGALRAAPAAMGGIAAGAIGLTAGIASGDLGKTFSYTSAGIVAGGIAGASRVNPSMPTQMSGVVDEYRRGLYGEDGYKAKKKEKEYKRTVKSAEFQQQLSKEIGQKEADELIKSGAIKTYTDSKITDAKTVAKLEKMQKDKYDIAKSAEEAVALYSVAEQLGNPRYMSQKNYDEHMNKMVREFQATNSADAAADARKTMEKIQKIYDL